MLNNFLGGITATIIAYLLARQLQRRVHWIPATVVAPILLGLGLYASHTSWSQYQASGRVVTFILGPATVALAVPLYRELAHFRHAWRAVVAGVVAGSVVGMVVSAGLVWLLGGDRQLVLTMVPKSVTTPIALAIVQSLGGISSIAAVFTIITGLFGSLVGPWLLQRVGVRSPLAQGTAMGTAASGLGTARMLDEGAPVAGSVAGFAMALSGVVVSVFSVPLHFWR